MENLTRHLAATTDRWELFKPVIEQLYMVDKEKLGDIVAILKNDHGFDAGENQYKYHFKKWGWKRNLSARKKTEIATQLESRARAGKARSTITLNNRAVDMKQIRRHTKKMARLNAQDMVLGRGSRPARTVEGITGGPVLPFANSIFMKWNIPYAAMRESQARPLSHASPFSYSVPTPGSGIIVVTPSNSTDSPQNAPSPTALLLKRKSAIDRAHLFAQGQHEKLLMSMDKEERVEMSEWLYQYWFFCFKTAKNWGKGPRNWTAETLQFDRYHDTARRSLPTTPSDNLQHSEDQPRNISKPTNLCRWLLHVKEPEQYEELPEPDYAPVNPDPHDESTWSEWPEEWKNPPLHIRLRDALEHNDFSSIHTANLPVAVPQIARAAERSPDELLLESFGFSIMSRNLEQVEEIMTKLKCDGIDFSALYPLHIATSYLDGHSTCCSLVWDLLSSIQGKALQDMYTNDLGHTVVDNLMISILKSHSSVTPGVINKAWKDAARFPGEEVDICGRWDADSECVRQLLASGIASIPASWKHKFCHTSVQTVCHSLRHLEVILGVKQLKNTTSGLFVRYCFDCGMTLQLKPLHTLVMTAYHLACSGFEDEDLFGILACLLGHITSGFDPLQGASISVRALINDDDPETVCDHEDLTPAELCEKLSESSTAGVWSDKIRTGWSILCGVLRICQDYYVEYDEPEYVVRDKNFPVMDDNDFIGIDPPNDYFMRDHYNYHSPLGLFQFRKDLSSLWAAIQAELLTYRRLNEGDSWISEYFSMESLHAQLERGNPLSLRFAEESLLRTHCICGEFESFPFPTLSDITKRYVANLDVWQRTTYMALREDYQAKVFLSHSKDASKHQ